MVTTTVALTPPDWGRSSTAYPLTYSQNASPSRRGGPAGADTVNRVRSAARLSSANRDSTRASTTSASRCWPGDSDHVEAPAASSRATPSRPAARSTACCVGLRGAAFMTQVNQ